MDVLQEGGTTVLKDKLFCQQFYTHYFSQSVIHRSVSDLGLLSTIYTQRRSALKGYVVAQSCVTWYCRTWNQTGVCLSSKLIISLDFLGVWTVSCYLSLLLPHSPAPESYTQFSWTPRGYLNCSGFLVFVWTCSVPWSRLPASHCLWRSYLSLRFSWNLISLRKLLRKLKLEIVFASAGVDLVVSFECHLLPVVVSYMFLCHFLVSPFNSKFLRAWTKAILLYLDEHSGTE